MAQEIKIGVSADLGKAAGQAAKVDKAVDGAAQAADDLADFLDRVGKSSKVAGDRLRELDAIAQRLRRTQEILSRDLGGSIDPADATLFLHNFDRMRRGRTLGTQKIRSFDDFESWYLGHGTMFRNAADAARHRRYIMALGMQGTGYSQQHGIPAFPPAAAPPMPPAHHGGASPSPAPPNSSAVQHAKNQALSFGKGMLALAGINSVMAMAGAAVDMATEEAVGIDTLKRRLGDIGVGYGKLMDQVRGAGDGLGLTFVEGTRLSQQFAKAVGKDGQINTRGDLRTALGFSRAFGLDPSEGVEFFGTSKHYGAFGSGEQDARRYALFIAEAIERSGYSARSEELLSAIAEFTGQTARLSLSRANTLEYTATLAGMARSGIAGLDPSNAASILGAADAAVRRGGGMGEAGLNFSYAALARFAPGMHPIAAQALLAGGIFGTHGGVFGKGTALGEWMSRSGASVPEGGDLTNFEKLRRLMREQYGAQPWIYLDAMKNFFGLGSIQHAAALDIASSVGLGATQDLVGRAGLKLSDLSASGIQGLVRVAGASTGDLGAIYDQTIGRDISAEDKAALRDARASGDAEKLRVALARAIGTNEQEKTDGTETRKTIADLKNELTRVGNLLLVPLDAVRAAVVAIAETVAPASYRASGAPPLPSAVPGNRSGAALGLPSMGGLDVGSGPFKLSAEEDAAIRAAAGGDPAKAALMRAILAAENRGKPGPDNLAVSPRGATGAFQFMPGTWGQFGEGAFRRAYDFDTSARAASRFIDWIKKTYNTDDPAVIAAYYNGGDRAARAVLAGEAPPAKETADYVNMVTGNLSTPLPAGDPAGKAERERAANITVGFTPADVMIRSAEDRRLLGTATLQPKALPAPAGAH